MSYAPTTKQDFYRRWKALEFGNRIRTWGSQAELLASGHAGTVTARSVVASGVCVYGVPAAEAASSSTYAGMTFSESAPDEHLLTQGELFRGVKGYSLFCSYAKLPMRKALAESGRQFYGLEALGRLKAACNPNGYEMLMDLLDAYPDAVVEFGCYAHNLGALSHSNVLIWEVRNY